MKKIKSTFHFENGYINRGGIQKMATVVLTIDYSASIYSVNPICSPVNGSFGFVNCSENVNKWKSVLFAIDEAIDFAEKELAKN